MMQSLNYQIEFQEFSEIADAIKVLENSSTIDDRGAIFTRPEVVHFILDLVQYTANGELYKRRILEPSMGNGDFLMPVIQRLLTSWKKEREDFKDVEVELANSIVAVELHIDTFNQTSDKVTTLLIQNGLSQQQANSLANQWLIQGDFLLVDIQGKFDIVIGNPPYVRQELIPTALLREYRARYRSFYDRADLYIPFIERSLALLATEGSLGFICSDRWMKNRYGGPLRKIVANNFHLRYFVDMVDTPAFYHEVSAYPAITVISRGIGNKTRIAVKPNIEKGELETLASLFLQEFVSPDNSLVKEIITDTQGQEPFILEMSERLKLVRKLEGLFPILEETGCKVGIGVATGADKVFIASFDELDVESDRKIPLATTKDLVEGKLSWQGLGVINPFNDDGSLVDLKKYPRLNRYLTENRPVLEKRHVAIKNANNWYRTIDRINPKLSGTKKLFIPDIKYEANIAYDSGVLYPHHNLYYITSEEWDLQALQAVLCSGIARLFVSIYSTKMRGGYFRFQAQYLRKIRLPKWSDLTEKIKNDLIGAALLNDRLKCKEIVSHLYNLNDSESELIN